MRSHKTDERAQELEQVRKEVVRVKRRIAEIENAFQFAEDDMMVESCVYELKALHTRLDYLIQTARRIAHGDKHD